MFKSIAVIAALSTLIGVEWSSLDPGRLRQVISHTGQTIGVQDRDQSLVAVQPALPELLTVPPRLIPNSSGFRRDFDFTVMMRGERRIDETGVRHYLENDLVQFSITPSRECWVAIWSINADGTVDQILPYPGEPNIMLQAGQSLTLPQQVEVVMTPSSGVDEAWILCSSHPFDATLALAQSDRKTFEQQRSAQRFQSLRRSLQLSRSEIQLSESVIRFTVHQARP